MLERAAEGWSLRLPFSLLERCAGTCSLSRKVGRSLFRGTLERNTEPYDYHWLHSLQHRGSPFNLSNLLRPYFRKERVVCSCKKNCEVLQPSALRHCLQHDYDLLQRSRVRLYNSSPELFHAERIDLKIFTKLLSLKYFDKSRKRTAIDVSMTTRR